MKEGNVIYPPWPYQHTSHEETMAKLKRRIEEQDRIAMEKLNEIMTRINQICDLEKV